MFPVYVKYPQTELPDSGIHYVVAKNGTFLTKGSFWYRATVPIDKISILELQEPELNVSIKAISAEVLMKAWLFFQAITKKHNAEAAVLLYYDQATEKWDIDVPQQIASSMHVGYEIPHDAPKGVLMGTMHSHNIMPAFHSGTDVNDEAEFDGIHITFGRLNDPFFFDWDGEIVINGHRFDIPTHFLEGVTEISDPNDHRKKSRHRKYSLVWPGLGDWKVPEEWMRNVHTHKGLLFLGSDTATTIARLRERQQRREKRKPKQPQ